MGETTDALPTCGGVILYQWALATVRCKNNPTGSHVESVEPTAQQHGQIHLSKTLSWAGPRAFDIHQARRYSRTRCSCRDKYPPMHTTTRPAGRTEHVGEVGVPPPQGTRVGIALPPPVGHTKVVQPRNTDLLCCCRTVGSGREVWAFLARPVRHYSKWRGPHVKANHRILPSHTPGRPDITAGQS